MFVDTTDVVKIHRENSVSNLQANVPINKHSRGSLLRGLLLLGLLFISLMIGFLAFWFDRGFRLPDWKSASNGLGVTSKTDSKIRASNNPELTPPVIGLNSNADFQIFSDTALATNVFGSFSSCKAKIEATLTAVDLKKSVLFKISQRNIAYLQFEGPSNNYVIRCFDVANKYRIFISGSSSSVDRLNEEMKLLYEVFELG